MGSPTAIARLQQLAGRAAGDLAGDPIGSGLLPVSDGIGGLVPDGIRRGATVAVQGATSLAIAVAARTSQGGGWCAAVGPRSLGFLAVADLGVDLARFPVIEVSDPLAWARATTALLDACDVVLGWPPPGLNPTLARRLSATARERKTTLVSVGAWPFRPDLELSVTRSEWRGIGWGHGRLRARRMEVAVTGRGSAMRARPRALWLPDAEGRVTLEEDDAYGRRAVR